MDNELHLMLHGRWFDEVLSGSKRVEYRQIKPRWTKQIWECKPTKLVLHRGYTRNVIRAAVTLIDIGPCPYKGWDGDYYRVHFEVDGDRKKNANSGGLRRLVRDSRNSLSFRTAVTCACGAHLRVIDHAPRRDGFRYEVTCDACLMCDPNGYGSQREVVSRYFTNTGRQVRRESEQENS